MDFQVSARKWRPQKFSELIGQEHIVRTLSNAIELERVRTLFYFLVLVAWAKRQPRGFLPVFSIVKKALSLTPVVFVPFALK